MNKRLDIQILRSLAVIFVVLFHLEIAGIESGFLGVDVFFVVSGFLMAIIYKKGEAKKFFERRAKRLLPAYFATVALTITASLFLVLPSELDQVFTQSVYSLFFANNIGFWMQNSYFSKSDFNPLLHLWSLGVEIQFYLIVPVLAYFFRKSKIFLFSVLLGSFAACVFIVGISPKTSFFMMPFRIWEFLIGFAIAYYLTVNGVVKHQKLRWLGLIGLLTLCAIPFVHVDGETLNRLQAHPSFYALAVCVATGLVLGFGLPKLLENNVISRFFAKIGDYSYSIYLVHFPIIVLYLYEPFSGTKLYPESYIDKIVLLVIIIVLSIAMHRLIENRKFNNIGKVYFISLVSVLFLAVVGRFIPSFYSQQDQNIFSGLKDRSTYRCGKIVRITDPSAISCKINKDDFSQSVLLVGNSHADSIKVAFAEVASANRYNTYFLLSNVPLMDKSLTPDILIKEANRLKIRRLVLHYSAMSFNNSFIETIKEMVKLADKSGIQIDFILPVPVYSESIPKMLYEKNFIEIYDDKAYLKNNAHILRELKKLTMQYDGFETFDVYQMFCNKQCAIADKDAHPFYFDAHHLTLTGAKKLKPVFESIME